MRFTGANLEMVRQGLCSITADIKNQIATCPDPVEYQHELELLERDYASYRRLLHATVRAIMKEKEKEHEDK